jgi:uncharacterized membrane protein
VLALLIGLVAGMRVMIALAAVSWAAYFGYLDLDDGWLAFLGYQWTPRILTLLVIVELIVDQLPSTASRKVPWQFAARLLSGGVSGAAIAVTPGAPLAGALVGIVGAILTTFGGSAYRARMSAAFGSDRPGALIEDAIAIVVAVGVVLALR